MSRVLQDNHMHRRNGESRTLESVIEIDEKQHELERNLVNMAQLPTGGDIKHMGRLKGPKSPLEVKFISMFQRSYNKSVMANGSSVNCVVLDKNQEERVLISSSTVISSKTKQIELR